MDLLIINKTTIIGSDPWKIPATWVHHVPGQFEYFSLPGTYSIPGPRKKKYSAAMGEDQIFVGKNWENLYLKIFEFFSVLMLFIIFFNITTCLWLPFKHISWHFQPKPSRPRGPPCPYQFDKHPIKCRKWILRIQSKRRSESLFLIHTYTTHRLTRASHHIFTWTPFNQWSILIPGRHHSKGSIQIFLEPIEFFF